MFWRSLPMPPHDAWRSYISHFSADEAERSPHVLFALRLISVGRRQGRRRGHAGCVSVGRAGEARQNTSGLCEVSPLRATARQKWQDGQAVNYPLVAKRMGGERNAGRRRSAYERTERSGL